jgi:3-oxoacyl-[acyl-carrier protein] reductase
MTKILTGKVALVTGGSRGIGAAIATRLARDGAAVALTYANAQQKADEVVRAIEAAGGRALAIRADSADAAAVQSAVAETVRTFGRLDVLVNNAGIAVIATLNDFSLNDFDRMVAVNVRGVCAMTKAAVAGLTRGLARDLGPRGITINTVQPGPVDTDMNPADGPFAESMKGMMALGRYGQGDEIAGLVAYLASPDAGFVTGASLTIDGGYAA